MNKITTALKQIAAENGGRLRPADVVEAARPKASPLHNRFEWDDTEAAERYRLHQARQLISVSVDFLGGDPKSADPVFFNLTTDRQDASGYRLSVDVFSDADLRRQLLRDAASEMEVFQRKYARLKELARVFSAMRIARRGMGKAVAISGKRRSAV